MTCSEQRIVALLADELEAGDRAELDEHLLSCSVCWRAVREDRAGALALELLREPAPPGLEDRVRLAVLLGEEHAVEEHAVEEGPLPATGTRRSGAARASRRLVLAAAAACVLLAAAAGLLVAALSGPGAADPPVVSALATMAAPGQAGPAQLASTHRSETMIVAGQTIVLDAYRVEGVVAVVARSSRPFAMPPASQVMSGSSAKAWMATRGAVSLWCVNSPAGGHSILVAARMPVMQLPAALSHLHVPGW